MGAVSSRYAAFGGAGLQSGSDQDDAQPVVKDRAKRPSCTRRHSSGDTVECPTCQGIGRIPRGQESQLVAVIPCTDQRLRPRHTRLYVAGSVGVCLLASALVLFFLFPRAIVLSPVAVKSSIVHFAKNSVQINITNVLNITNNNFMEVQAYNFTVQALNDKMVVGKTSIKNMTFVKPLSVQKYPFMISINLKDPGLSDYCKNPSVSVHILFVHLQMSMTVYYMAHYEDLSLETYEYIDCGANSTVAHCVEMTGL